MESCTGRPNILLSPRALMTWRKGVIMNRIKTWTMLLLAALATFGLLAGAAQAGPTPVPSLTPTATPTPTTSPTPTQTPQPPLEEGCFCRIKNVNPAGNIAALRNTATGDKGSTLTRSLVINMKGENITPGSCPQDARNVVEVSVFAVDDDGDVLIAESKRGFNCNAGGATNAKFLANYDVLNCKDSVAPANTSFGDVTITVSNEQDFAVFTRRVHCKAN
jgi:hypothetical protein